MHTEDDQVKVPGDFLRVPTFFRQQSVTGKGGPRRFNNFVIGAGNFVPFPLQRNRQVMHNTSGDRNEMDPLSFLLHASEDSGDKVRKMFRLKKCGRRLREDPYVVSA